MGYTYDTRLFYCRNIIVRSRALRSVGNKIQGVYLLLKRIKRPILSCGKLSSGDSHQHIPAFSNHGSERSRRDITLCPYNSKEIRKGGWFACLICIIEQ